ncbi:MAG: molybdopterin-synthase adenylyltransferase MoeB [Wenzhouxiangella sp.]
MDDERKAAADRLRAFIDQAGSDIEQIDPPTALARQAHEGALLIDIRESWEWANGSAEHALKLSRGLLELEIDRHAANRDQSIILMCAGGDRSQLAARSLKQLGYRKVANLVGGFNAWQQQGLPVAGPEDDADPWFRQRYARHLAMPSVGLAGQERLRQAHVAVIGAGGLGSPVALYLAAAGVGRLTLIDGDRVERSNLQRQILHADHLVGHLKVESASARLHALNPTIELTPHAVRLDETNVGTLLAPVDLVIDGSDNFPTRYLVNRYCADHGLPMVYGAVMEFSGQVAVFDPASGGACYRCLFPESPAPEDAPNCSEAGVLGVMPGIVGCLQANEALKLLLGLGESLKDRLLLIDGLGGRFREIRLRPDPSCRDCGQARGGV